MSRQHMFGQLTALLLFVSAIFSIILILGTLQGSYSSLDTTFLAILSS